MVSLWISKGEVKNGLLVDPRDEMAYYPLGSSIVAFPLRGGQKSFLTGHTYLIGTIAISNSGKYLASGETDNVGTKVKPKSNLNYYFLRLVCSGKLTQVLFY